MNAVFYIAAIVAIISTVLAITRLNAVHALLYLIVSLLSVAVVFYVMGAPFIAALEVIIYAGAIMVLFIFVVMMLNLGKEATETERQLQKPGMWVGPSILAAILIAEVAYLLSNSSTLTYGVTAIEPKQVGIALFGPYLIGVELASMLLMGALVGAYHLGRRTQEKTENRNGVSTHASGAAPGGDFVRAGTDRASGSA
ncbi:MAG TPA: NADH-quinone oxidoreductase subunit J [Terriglobia bacterium]|nr:NADH-quinone oxidoreductase subunit J [Terriglobia bacterium]